MELNKSNLGKNNSLIVGRKYKLPAKVGTKSGKAYPIFGKDHEIITPKSSDLKGAIYYDRDQKKAD